MPFSALPLVWKIVAFAVFFTLVAAWAFVWGRIVDWIPPEALYIIAPAVMLLAIGFAIGQRYGQRYQRKVMQEEFADILRATQRGEPPPPEYLTLEASAGPVTVDQNRGRGAVAGPQ